MSLHDVDKNHDQRLNPKPNSNDSLVQRQAHGTNSVNYTTDATNPATNSLILSGNARLIYTNTVLVDNDGSTVTTVRTPHGLNFIPIMTAAMNNATATGIPVTVNYFLPLVASANIDTVNNRINFRVWLAHSADITNANIQMFNSTGVPQSVSITYYLYQQTAGTS